VITLNFNGVKLSTEIRDFYDYYQKPE